MMSFGSFLFDQPVVSLGNVLTYLLGTYNSIYVSIPPTYVRSCIVHKFVSAFVATEKNMPSSIVLS